MEDSMKFQIVVTLQHEAVHNWPGVVDHPELRTVSYLAYPHRHVFHIKCKKLVTHEDRDVEIINFKHDIEEYLASKITASMGSMSCEMLAIYLIKQFDLSYCEVLEDGENGACVEA